MLFRFLIFALPLVVDSRYHRFQYDQRNIRCHCVAQHLCADNDIALNGHGLLDPRGGNRKCPSPEEICCEPNFIKKNDHQENVKKNRTVRCGVQDKFNAKFRIASGSTASFGELPWNLIVQEGGEDKEKNLYKCGASLIHPKVALTAAHCVEPYSEQPEKIIVRAGEWDVNSRDEPLPFQDNYVEEILINSDYNPLSFKNDIALLFLAENFELTRNVGIICLSSDEKVIENKCIASGWGKNTYKHGLYSSVLKKIEIPLVPRNHCLQTLRATRLGPRFNLHKSFICAGGKKGQDSCKGDGGGPLICPVLGESERFVQIGIVSWGIGCGDEGIPGVYVNVPRFLDWIDSEMNDRDLDINTYRK